MRPLDAAGRVHQLMLEPVKNGCLQFILAEGGEVCTSALASAVAHPKCSAEKFDEAGFNSSQPLNSFATSLSRPIQKWCRPVMSASAKATRWEFHRGWEFPHRCPSCPGP
jgi:hypothetical protein